MTCYAFFKKNKDHIAAWKLQFPWLREKNENKMYLKCISQALKLQSQGFKSFRRED